MLPRSFWKLSRDVNGYSNDSCNELATQVCSGRSFMILAESSSNTQNAITYQVILLEDGYKCWLKFSDLLESVVQIFNWKSKLFTPKQIKAKIPLVMKWIENSSMINNRYLWGGTLGPDFDCSGLIQTAFASESIWIPRDAFQQEMFCKNLHITLKDLHKLEIGDLLFFGPKEFCNHVAIYKGNGLYWHSSGKDHGRNGIGVNGIEEGDKNLIACYYRSIFRSAGRVVRCHDGIDPL